MASKAVTDRQKNARAVMAAASTHAESIANGLGPILSARLERGEKLPDLALLTKLLERTLEIASAELVAADAAHQAELRDDDAPRAARDEAAEELRAELVELRSTVLGLYGQTGLKALALVGETPRDPVVLSRFASDVLSALPTASLPPSKVKGAKLDTKEVAQALAPLLKALDKHMTTVAREEKEAHATLTRKNAAQQVFDERFSSVATLLSALLQASGQTELASRVRPSPRRGGVLDPEPPPEPSPVPAPPVS
jgi:hypothetical protein